MAILNEKQRALYPRQYDPVELAPEDQFPINEGVDLNEDVAPNGLPQQVLQKAEAMPASQKLMQMHQAGMIPTSISGNYESMINSPEYKAKLQELAQLSKNSLDQQQAGVNQNAAAIQAYGNRLPEFNLMPTAALTDAWTGSHFANSYKQPESADERAKSLISLNSALQGQRKDLSQEQIANVKAQLEAMQNPFKMGMQQAKLNQNGQRIGMMADRMTAQAVKEIDNHPLMQKATAQLAQLDIDKHTVETTPIITPQILREISNGIANALNQGKAAGFHSADLQDLSTLQTYIAQKEQYLSDSPKDGASPEIRKQVVDTLDRLHAAYAKYQETLAARLAQGRTYENTPQAQRGIKTTVDKYKMPPQAPIPESIKIKVSNGKETFEISPEDLSHAQADGFKEIK